MAKTRVFTSFDFDHDEDLCNLLVGQAKNLDSPFELADWSVKEQFGLTHREAEILMGVAYGVIVHAPCFFMPSPRPSPDGRGG